MVRHLAPDSQWKPLPLLMVNLKTRWNTKELLDADDIPFEDIKVCMKELNTVNSLLGGHSITLKGTKSFINSGNTPFHICEIGCGGGDNLKAIAKKYSRINPIRFTGIDLKKECTDFAAQRYPGLNATWMANDYRNADLNDHKPDVIFSSLFCHHFKDDELVAMLQWMRSNSTKGFFINDLQRSRIAYYLIKWLSAIFSKSYLVKNDACISVARSFRKKDWQLIIKNAGITNYDIRWQWAFRYLIVFKND